MDIESLKWWHWAAVGLVVGLSVGYVKQRVGVEGLIGGPGFISQQTFEGELRLPPVRGMARLTDMRMRPDQNFDLVTLRRLMPVVDRRGWVYETWYFAAPRPYRPLSPGVQTDRADYSVSDYVAQATDNKTLVRSPWWNSPDGILALWTIGGILAIGGAWPVVLRLLTGAGFGRRPADDYDLSRFHGEPAAVPAQPTPEQEAKLRELEEAMAANLAASASESAAAPAPAKASPAPVALPNEPLPAAATPAAEESRHYTGVYYPVALPEAAGHHPSERAFTLVELLVVLGIIAFLASLLMPSLRVARESARQVKCAAQLRQLGQALIMYANSNQQWLPSWSGWHTFPAGQSDDSPGAAWTVQLEPYFVKPDAAVYTCPAFLGDSPVVNYFLSARWSHSLGQQAMKLTDVKMSSRFVLSGDMTNSTLYLPPFGTAPHTSDDCDKDDAIMKSLCFPEDEGGFWMHRRGNNVLFDDGHVASFAHFDPARMTYSATDMRNWEQVVPTSPNGY